MMNYATFTQKRLKKLNNFINYLNSIDANFSVVIDIPGNFQYPVRLDVGSLNYQITDEQIILHCAAIREILRNKTEIDEFIRGIEGFDEDKIIDGRALMERDGSVSIDVFLPVENENSLTSIRTANVRYNSEDGKITKIYK